MSPCRPACTPASAKAAEGPQGQHLGPEELLVAVKIGVRGASTAADISQAIDDAEARIRAAVPIARVIYIEPAIYHAPEAEGKPA